MHVGQRGGELHEHGEDFLHGGVLALQPQGQRPAVHVVQEQVHIPARLVWQVPIPARLDDVGVFPDQQQDFQLAQRARMRPLVVAARLAVPRQLERVQLAVLLHEVHEAKAAIPQRLNHLEAVNHGSRRQPHHERGHRSGSFAGTGIVTGGKARLRPSGPLTSRVKTRPALAGGSSVTTSTAVSPGFWLSLWLKHHAAPPASRPSCS